MNPTSTFAPKTFYIVRTSSAPNKASWKWQHRRRNVAVLAVVPDASPKMISERARGVLAIMSFDGCLYWGGPRSEGVKALRRAEALASRLNAQAQRACDAVGGVASCG